MHRKLPIFYSALLLTGVNLLLRLISTGFQVYLSGQIGAAGIGLLQLILSVGSLALVAGVAGVRTATMYLTAEQLGKGHRGQVVWVLSGCFTYSIFCSCAVAAALYYFAPQIAQAWIADPKAVHAVRMLAGFLPANCLCGVMVGYFTAANRIGTLAIVEIAEQFFSMTVTILALQLWAKQDPYLSCQSVVLGSGCGSVLTLGCLIVLRIKEHSPAEKRRPVARSLLRTAVPLALADDLKSGINTTENLMVPKRLALYPHVADPLAAFGTVCGMVFPVLMFPAAILFSLAELLIPELARCNAAGSHKRIRYLTRKSLRIAMLYGCAFSGLMFLAAKPLCFVLYHSHDAGRYLQWFALLIPMLYCDAITDAMIKGLGQQTACVRYNIFTSAMDVALLFVLLPRYGIGGYFFSFFITHFINFGLSLGRLLKITNCGLRWGAPVLVLCCTAAGILTTLRVSSVALRCGGFLIIYLGLLLLAGVVGKDDLRWLRGLVRKK